MPRFRKTWIFDLDNTIYPAESGLFDQVSYRMTAFIQETFNLDRDGAFALQKDLFRRYGTTARGLMKSVSSNILVPFVSEITEEIEDMAGGTASSTAVGGMVTKIEAAKVATKSGCAVFIGSGETPGRLPQIIEGQAEGTFFAPAGLALNQRKKWLAFFPSPKGSIEIDQGACQAILENGASLLASGIIRASGEFDRSEVVSIIDPNGKIIARGICRFASFEIPKIIGLESEAVLQTYNWTKKAEVVHRDFLAPLISKTHPDNL